MSKTQIEPPYYNADHTFFLEFLQLCVCAHSSFCISHAVLFWNLPVHSMVSRDTLCFPTHHGQPLRIGSTRSSWARDEKKKSTDDFPVSIFCLIIHRLCAALTHEIFMQRKSQEATAYINFSLATEMKFMQSEYRLIHPSPSPQLWTHFSHIWQKIRHLKGVNLSIDTVKIRCCLQKKDPK